MNNEQALISIPVIAAGTGNGKGNGNGKVVAVAAAERNHKTATSPARGGSAARVLNDETVAEILKGRGLRGWLRLARVARVLGLFTLYLFLDTYDIRAAFNRRMAERKSVENAEDNLAEGKFLGLATSADPQVQGQGFIFLTETNSFFPGTALMAYLAFPGSPKKGVLMPSSALVRYEGQVFVYLQKADDKFEREEVKLDLPLKNGWLVAGDLSPGDKIVVTGAQQLLSEELKSRSGEE